MAQWQFFIQPEGQKNWQPVQSPMQLIAGKYRLIARGNSQVEGVEVKVFYREAETNRCRTQVRSRSVNAKGVVVVLPATDLAPGKWAVQIQANGQPVAKLIWRVDPDAIADLRSQSLAEIDNVLQETIASVWEHFEEVQSEVNAEPRAWWPELPKPDYPEISPPANFVALAQPDSGITLNLDHHNCIARQGQYITVTGTVEVPLTTLLSGAEIPSDLKDATLQGSLQYQFRDPQTAEITFDTEYPLLVPIPVGTFRHTLRIPNRSSSRLLLAEATLYGQDKQILASQSFLVSSDLEDLLSLVITEPEAMLAMANPPLPKPQKPQEQPMRPYRFTEPSSVGRSPLPQAIAKTKPKNCFVQLPHFAAGQRPQARPEITSKVEEPTKSIPETAPVIPSEPPELPTREATDQPDISPPVSPDHLLNKLHTLADDHQLHDYLRTQVLLDAANLNSGARFLLPADSDLESYEVVVDDEPAPPAQPRYDSSGFPYPQEAAPAAANAGIWAHVPVPPPVIVVPEEELTIGAAIPVRIKLPPGQSALYIKFWVRDCQNSILIDGPRVILGLAPNPNQELEALTRVTLPVGCHWVRFEAIAIDPHRDQESRKASVERIAIPPDTIQASADVGNPAY